MDSSGLRYRAWRYVGIGLALAVCVLASAVVAPRASAASFTVNTAVDDVDASPGDGLCATPAGDCTLRAAVMETNALPDWDKIVVARRGAVLTNAGAFEDAAATGDLDVTDSLTIIGRGLGVAVAGGRGFEDRIFDVDPTKNGISVRMLGFTITRGDAFGMGGGINNHDTADLTLIDMVVKSNRVSGAIANLGGGIENSGELLLQHSQVVANQASGNMFSVGGGISNGGPLTIDASSITGNGAQANGGGLYNGAPGTASVTSSTIADNRSGHSGGGVWNRSQLTMENSTISGNDAVPWGGGLNNNLGTAILTHVTVAANSAGFFGAGIYDTGGGGTVELRNSLVDEPGQPGAQSCDGLIQSGGGNLDSGTSCGFSMPTDISKAGSQVAPLAFNGGPTATHAVKPGSLAIDAAVAANCTAHDQRGIARPQGSGCDIGAYEAP
jgi:large repetitive protein